MHPPAVSPTLTPARVGGRAALWAWCLSASVLPPGVGCSAVGLCGSARRRGVRPSRRRGRRDWPTLGGALDGC